MGLGDIDCTSLCSSLSLSLILRGHPSDRACTKGWRRSYAAAAAGSYWRRRQPDLTAASRIGDGGTAEGSTSP